LNYTGTYTVTPDCTGSATLNTTLPGNPILQLKFVIDDGGKEIRFTRQPFGAMNVSGTARKQ
jgi:hypothetical protein